jgi:hypothetical protein
VFTNYAIVFDKKISLKEIAEKEDVGESSWEENLHIIIPSK